MVTRGLPTPRPVPPPAPSAPALPPPARCINSVPTAPVPGPGLRAAPERAAPERAAPERAAPDGSVPDRAVPDRPPPTALARVADPGPPIQTHHPP
jgi:hypothetical protein